MGTILIAPGDKTSVMHNPYGGGIEEAGRLYGLATQGGSIEGMYSLGWMHAKGLGVPQNTSRAAALYRQAVQQAPDWQHAAPPFIALLLLPGMQAMQALYPFLPSFTGLLATGEACTTLVTKPQVFMFSQLVTRLVNDSCDTSLPAFSEQHLQILWNPCTASLYHALDAYLVKKSLSCFCMYTAVTSAVKVLSTRFLALKALYTQLLVQCAGMLTKRTVFRAAGWPRMLQQGVIQTSVHISWDTWVLTAAAASLSWVLWRRHKRFLQTQHTRHTRANSETGVG